MYFLRSLGIMLVGLVFTLLAACSSAPSTQPISRIAFGSCSRQDQPQPIWESIVAAKPDVFIFLGDNIYGDTENMTVMRAKYEMLASQPAFQKLREDATILATWDDHDMGKNDAGVEFPMKEQSKQELMRFLNEPKTSARRDHPGVYDAYTFGPAGKRVQIILLDTRWFRSPLKSRRDEHNRLHYEPDDNPAKTMLGEQQWAWLEEQLKQPADVRIIASSIQVLSGEHRFEKWNNFPRERQRLLDLIDAAAGDEPVVLLSGDRHTAEISKLDRPGEPPLYDITASSLNRAGSSPLDEPNAYRVGERYQPPNFGMIEIDWSGKTPKLSLQLRDVAGKTVREAEIN
ncbi:MAG TPA: alkaline phosphatase D family protein [Tepidisphaeraceae bacterium]|nr:alkaline phosphatase D family protein [Tepidisphaeraceae bacterium]